MKVLMFGWEFPPIASGGLGTACFGLTQGLKHHNVDVTFVMPRVPQSVSDSHVELISANDVVLKDSKGNIIKDFAHEVIEINSILTPYLTSEQYLKRMDGVNTTSSTSAGIQVHFGKSEKVQSIYGKDLYHEVWRYRQKARMIAQAKTFDVIHCHDWMTYGAGIEAKKVSGKPLVVHIHATEFDRTANNPNMYVYNLEKEGFDCADKILAVSNYTRNMVIEKYGIPSEKVEVVHNAVDLKPVTIEESSLPKIDEKIVLFLGRLTVQKGPDWFVYTAKRVLDYYPDVKFVVAGSGDMEPFIVQKVAEMGLSDKFMFTGFLTGKDIDRAYRMASLYVMPSISEPFGITPLESMKNGTPVLISRQSGVSEVITNCLKTDFWDIDEMTNKIGSVLENDALHQELKSNGLKEVKKFTWNEPAQKCVRAYTSVINSYITQQNASFFSDKISKGML